MDIKMAANSDNWTDPQKQPPKWGQSCEALTLQGGRHCAYYSNGTFYCFTDQTSFPLRDCAGWRVSVDKS